MNTQQTETGIDTLCQQAADMLADGTITDHNRAADDCGELTLIRVDFADGSFAIAGAEYSDDDGRDPLVVGYTWTHYWPRPSDEGCYGEPGKTDGGPDVTRFARDMRILAAGG